MTKSISDLQQIPNTLLPAPGKGLTLDGNGKLPVPVQRVTAGYEFAYTEFTSTVSVSSTTEATPDDVVAASATQFDGQTVIVVEFFAAGVDNQTAGIATRLCLWDGSTELGIVSQTGGSSSDRVLNSVRASRRLTPTSGSHTYKIRAYKTGASTGNVYAGTGTGAGSLMPGYIRITRA